MCTVCNNLALRAHHTDLVKHATKSDTYIANLDKYNVSKQSRLEQKGGERLHYGSLRHISCAHTHILTTNIYRRCNS